MSNRGEPHGVSNISDLLCLVNAVQSSLTALSKGISDLADQEPAHLRESQISNEVPSLNSCDGDVGMEIVPACTSVHERMRRYRGGVEQAGRGHVSDVSDAAAKKEAALEQLEAAIPETSQKTTEFQEVHSADTGGSCRSSQISQASRKHSLVDLHSPKPRRISRTSADTEGSTRRVSGQFKIPWNMQGRRPSSASSLGNSLANSLVNSRRSSESKVDGGNLARLRNSLVSSASHSTFNSQDCASGNPWSFDAMETMLLDVEDLHEVWHMETRRRRHRGNTFGTKTPSLMMMNNTFSSEFTDKPQSCSQRCVQRVVANPSSKRRLLWDITGMALAFYDLISIPLSAFDPPTNLFLQAMAWTTTIYWTVDIPCTFFVGYHSDGIVEMDLWRIAQHYARTWLFFDVMVVSADWLVIVLGVIIIGDRQDLQGGEYMRMGRAARFLRMLRLLRLLKVQGILADLLDRIQSEFIRITLGVAKLLILVLLVNHVLACAFWYIGTMELGLTKTWVEEFKIVDRSLAYRYTTALHWSVTQFTPASMEIVPTNALERTYTVLVLVFALVMFSSFISSITSAMTQLRELDSAYLEDCAVLRRYLVQHRISSSLTTRLWGWLHRANVKTRRRVHEEDVAMIKCLPKKLHDELQEQVCTPVICSHPFFAAFRSLHGPLGMLKLYQTLAEISLRMGQELFCLDDEAHRVFFLLSGVLHYFLDVDFEDPDGEGNLPTPLVGLQVVAEPALWVKWRYRGQMVAASQVELYGMDVQNFHRVVEQNMLEHQQSATYAWLFVKWHTEEKQRATDIMLERDVLERLARASAEPIEEMQQFSRSVSRDFIYENKSDMGSEEARSPNAED